MIQEVKLRVRGMQRTNDESDDDIEVVCLGQMCEQDGFICLSYEDAVEEDGHGNVQFTKNVIKIRDDQIEVIKRGPWDSHLVFVPQQPTYTYYSTPFGELEMSIFTKKILNEKRADGFHFQLKYDLEMDHTFISECNVDIEVEI